MSFSLWLNKQNIISRLRLAQVRLLKPGPTTVGWVPWLLSTLILVIFITPWINPFWLWYAVFALFIVLAITAWQYFISKTVIGFWLATYWVLISFWVSTFLLWLFLENIGYRLLFLIIITLLSWWYLAWWRGLKTLIYLNNPLGNLAPPTILSYVAVFSLGTTAHSFLVFLNTPWWVLTLAFYLPMALLLVAILQINYGSWLKKWRSILIAAVLLGQIFFILLWWPTSFYVVGFTLSIVFALILLGLRQEGQGFINTRQVRKELVILLVALALVLLTARWS